MRFVVRPLLIVGAAVALASPALAQSTGTIVGRVIERTTNRPLAGVQIRVVGTTRGAATNDSGAISNPRRARRHRAARRATHRIRRVVALGRRLGREHDDRGFHDGSRRDDARRDHGHRDRPDGAQARERRADGDDRQLGASPRRPSARFSDALSSRVAGRRRAASAGETGAGSRIRIRGSNSISLSNDPLLIIDGIRADNSSQSSAQGTGGQLPSRFNDINPEEIESIEIIKGPAAAALYGTAAANGVIQITTKKGRAGQTRWDAFGESGNLTDINDYPLNLRSYGHTAVGRAGHELQPVPPHVRPHQCCVAVDSTVSNNPLKSSGIESDGNRRLAGASVTGGSDVAAYFVSGEYQKEQNVIAINGEQRLNLRTNLRTQLARSLDMQLNVGYIEQRPASPAERQQLVRRRLRVAARPRGELHADRREAASRALHGRHGHGEPRLLQPRHRPERLLQHQHAPARAAAHRRPDEQLDAARLAHGERHARRGHQPSQRQRDAAAGGAASIRRSRTATAASSARSSRTTRPA